MSANPRDENRVPSIAGVSSLTFTGNVVPAVNPATHALLIEGSLTPAGTQDVNLTQVSGAAFALGQQLAAASLPVVLTAAQISTLTPLSTVAVTQSTSPWVVSGTVAFSNSTIAVTNTGTFAVQATLQTQTDTVMVGGVNVKEINAVTPLMGNGTTGTGSLRVTIASDNTAFAVNATLSAETTKVIGTVNQGTSPWAVSLAAETTKVIGVTRTADGAGNLLTSNSTTYTAKFGLDGNLLGTLGTAFSTAGFVDIKGADGNVFVRQATGTNLHMVVDSGTITTVSTVTAVTTITNDVKTKPTPTSTATLANVAGSASSVTLIALNTNRLGATIVNDSTAQLYVKFGSSASATSYTYTLFQYETLEVPFGYTGIITGLWASATGNARTTEFTA